jgi:thioredoxin-like negative regulator of GroEL
VDGGTHGTEPRVYYFHAPHCGHCHAMTPLVDRLAATHGNLIEVDIAERPDLARGFRIAATPTIVRVEGGKIRTVKLGGLAERQLLALLASA